jgi:hypothetical protein
MAEPFGWRRSGRFPAKWKPVRVKKEIYPRTIPAMWPASRNSVCALT